MERRRFSQLLNAAGRAGRAGFANQGLVVAIPDQPVGFRSFNDVKQVRKQVDYLQRSDDSVRVESGLERFIDSVCEGTLRPYEASDLEMLMVSLLAGGDEGNWTLVQFCGRRLGRTCGNVQVGASSPTRMQGG